MLTLSFLLLGSGTGDVNKSFRIEGNSTRGLDAESVFFDTVSGIVQLMTKNLSFVTEKN
jgi:hypothetical protein